MIIAFFLYEKYVEIIFNSVINELIENKLIILKFFTRN
jgi:hypothetical protein